MIASTDPNNVDINTAYAIITGDKYFELSNHLGNLNDTWVFPNKTLSGISPDAKTILSSGVLQVVTDLTTKGSSAAKLFGEHFKGS